MSRVSPPNKPISNITRITGGTTRPLQIPARLQRSSVVQPRCPVVPLRSSIALLGEVLLETGAPDSAVGSVQDLLVDLGFGARRENGTSCAGSGVIAVAAAGAVERLHQAGIRMRVRRRNHSHATGGFLEDDRQHEPGIDACGGSDVENRLFHFFLFLWTVIGDAPLGARGPHLGCVVGEPVDHHEM